MSSRRFLVPRLERQSMRHSWLRHIARRVFGNSQQRRGTIARRKTAERHPTLETLEDRSVPTTFTVTNTNDTGAGSLRNAVAQANANIGADTIVFSSLFNTAQTITLTSGVITFAGDTNLTTVTGPGAGLRSVSGGHTQGVFWVNSGISASISGLTMTAGNSGNGGGLYNAGTVSLDNVTVSGSHANNTGANAGGGGLFNSATGTATLTN